MYKNKKEMSLNGDAFFIMKEQFDTVLNDTLTQMRDKGTEDASITLKLAVHLENDVVYHDDAEAETVMKPTFKHDISSVMQVKSKVSGQTDGDYAMVWDAAEGKYVLAELADGQMTIDDQYCSDDEEAPKRDGSTGKAVELLNDEGAPVTPFEWLKKFVGEKMVVTEAMGNYTVRTTDNRVVLSSATDLNSPFYCSAAKLMNHVGHNVMCVGYGDEEIVNVSIECEDCSEALYELDMPEDAETDYEYDEPEE